MRQIAREKDLAVMTFGRRRSTLASPQRKGSITFPGAARVLRLDLRNRLFPQLFRLLLPAITGAGAYGGPYDGGYYAGYYP